MGAIAVALDKNGRAAPSKVLTMLRELGHRGKIEPQVFCHPSALVAQSVGKLKGEEASSRVAVGTNNSEPVLGQDFVWVFEGRYFPPNPSIAHRIMHQANWHPLKISRQVLKELDGSYAFAILLPDKVLVGRDMMGLQPLYYGENELVCAVASERKALWKIGLSNVKSFPPGNLATINGSGFTFESISTLKQPVQEEVNMGEAARRLRKLLGESTLERVSDVGKIAVAFSGGLDSSVVAQLAKLRCSVHLVCVGLEGQKEVESAKDVAQMLELPLTVQVKTTTDVRKDLPQVLWLIEEPNTMKAGVAVPIFWTAEVAARLGYGVLLGGQSADELFGGYQRYLRDYVIGGTEKVRDSFYHDITGSYETNFQRDEPVCAFHKVELRLPFADKEVVNYALTLPINLKVESATDSLRKRVLRQVAENLGVPDSIANKPKKAIQFATGVDKAIKDLANKEGLTHTAYIKKVFCKVYPSFEVKRG